ncbi:MAG TPA: hypothetical protein DDW50_00450 [Firmicutes bacterium]|jgi:hypothetical protein|nr:hypothetical protein [Bacillota bacterium]
MDRYNRRWVSVEEHQKLQMRIEELEAENEKLKNRNDLVRELISFFATSNRPFMNTSSKQENSGSLEQFVELAKGLSNDIRNIMKTITKN